MDNEPLTAEECQLWINDLRSDEYKQCKARLKSKNQHGEYYCCLGVLETTQNKCRNGPFVLSTSVLNCVTQTTLAEMNDNGTSFEDIADYIEERILPKLSLKDS